MALQSSGEISLSQVNIELGLAATNTISLDDTDVRSLAAVSSGDISLSRLHGKSRGPVVKNISVTSNQTDFNILNFATANGWNASMKLALTINSGIYLLASSTSSYALNIPASFPNGLDIINNGSIIGAGGAGGGGSNNSSTSAGLGLNGGNSIYCGQYFSLVNNGIIGSGGGGGGGGGGSSSFLRGYGGGGGGGGAGSITSSGGLGGAGRTVVGQPGGVGNLSTFGIGGVAGAGGSAGNGGNGGFFGKNGSAGSLNLFGAGGLAGTAIVNSGNCNRIVTGTIYGSLA